MHCIDVLICRAGTSGPAVTVLAGPIFCQLRGVSRHTPSFYNIAMRIYSRLVRVRRSGHAVEMPTIAIEQKKEWPQFSQRKQKKMKKGLFESSRILILHL